MQEWLQIALAIFGALGIGGYLFELWKRRNPSKQETVDFEKTYAEAKIVHYQLTDQLKKMVEVETEKLRHILVNRELEHAEETKMYLKRIAECEDNLRKEIDLKEDYQKQLTEANQKIHMLEKRVSELEKSLNKTNNE